MSRPSYTDTVMCREAIFREMDEHHSRQFCDSLYAALLNYAACIELGLMSQIVIWAAWVRIKPGKRSIVNSDNGAWYGLTENDKLVHLAEASEELVAHYAALEEAK